MAYGRRCAVAGPTVQRTGSRSFPIASASSVSRAVVVVRLAKRCPDTGIRLTPEFAQASHQPPAVGIVLDDVLPAVTPCQDMIDGIGILDPQSSCHHPIESSCRVSFNKKF